LIAVAGGTGTLGTALVDELLERGQTVRILSRHRPASLATGCEHRSIDLSLSDSDQAGRLTSALEGVRTVVDAANNATRPGPLMLNGTERLLAACAVSGVTHFVGVSIVGCEKVGLGYYRAKARQEQLVRNSPVPWSLLRSTQFHELLDSLMSKTSTVGLLPGGAARLQPIACSEVGARLGEIAQSPPLNAAATVAGPEVASLAELSGVWRAVRRRRCLIVPLPLVGKTGGALKRGAFTDRDRAQPGPGFASWLESSGGQPSG
jgi:uncharacterized protein YbjT (DUF2867 family)